MNKHDSGASIIELMGYLSIGVLLAVGMFRMYGIYNQKIRRTAAGAQISSLAESARHMTYGKKKIKASLTAKLAAQGKNTLDPWGHPIEILSGERCIEVEFSRMSRGDCIYLVRTIKSDCKGFVSSINAAAQPAAGANAGVGADFAGSCDQPENTLKWFFAK